MKMNFKLLSVFMMIVMLSSCGEKNEIETEIAKTDLLKNRIGNIKVASLSNIIDFKILEQNFKDGILSVTTEMIIEKESNSSGTYTNRRSYAKGKMVYKKNGESWSFVEFTSEREDKFFPYDKLSMIENSSEYNYISRYAGFTDERNQPVKMVIVAENGENVSGYFVFDNQREFPDFTGKIDGQLLIIKSENFDIGFSIEGTQENKLNVEGIKLTGQMVANNRGYEIIKLFVDENLLFFNATEETLN